MRRSEKEITDRPELLRIVAGAKVCRVAMSDGARPYLVPLSFALDGDDLIAGKCSPAARRTTGPGAAR